MSKDSLIAFASRIKTPIAIASLALIVLYLLLSQMLGLDLFSRIDATQTSGLLQSLLSALFWLAMVSIVLSIAAYVLPDILRRRISHVKLVSEGLIRPAGDPSAAVRKKGSAKKK
jgi:hypothetical protein